MNREIQQRLKWVQLYEEHRDAGLVCRRCGISRPTLRKWWRRYQQAGLNGLESKSRRPHSSPAAKVGTKEEALMVSIKVRTSIKTGNPHFFKCCVRLSRN